LPISPLPSDFKVYKVEVKTDDLYKRDNIIANISLAGFKKLDQDDKQQADFTITVEPYPFTYSKAEATQSTSTSKNKDGVEVKTTTYGYSGTMTYKFVVKVSDKNDSVFFKDEYSGKTDLSTSGASSAKDAYSSYDSNRNSAPGNTISSQMGYFSNCFNEKHGYPKKGYYLEGFSVKVGRKCNFDYTDLVSAYDTLASAYKIVTTNENNVDGFMKKMEPSIAKWENALKESDVENKKARINEELTCAIYHNLGVTYFLAKEYPKAIEYFTKCKDIKKSYGYAAELINIASNFQKRIEANASSKSVSMKTE